MKDIARAWGIRQQVCHRPRGAGFCGRQSEAVPMRGLNDTCRAMSEIRLA